MAQKTTEDIDSSTEEKIKKAARKVFQAKGLAAARTRDIAKEAEVNLALLNYYFRSKEKLFEIIMYETLANFSRDIVAIFNDENTSLDEKIELIVARYSDMLMNEPNIPLFILNELQNHSPENLLDKLPVRQVFSDSVAVKQFGELAAEGKIPAQYVPQLLLNLLGLTVFPYIGKPFIMALGNINEQQFNDLMQARKSFIPLWMNAMMRGE